MSEAPLIKSIRLAATKLGARLFRNNVGIATYPNGSKVAYGLCDGSSDLIGWTPLVITAEHVGKTIAVFTAIEVKTPYVRTTIEQYAFLNAVNSAGGLSSIVTSVEEAEEAIRSMA